MSQAFSREELEAAGAPRFADPRTVRFQDVDAAGIVFYPRILEYFSDAYFAMLSAGGYDVPRTLREGAVGLPLVHAEADFLRPMRFGDAITVEIALVRLGETSFTVGYRIATPSGKPASVGQTVHVSLDRATFRPCPIPDALRSILGDAR